MKSIKTVFKLFPLLVLLIACNQDFFHDLGGKKALAVSNKPFVPVTGVEVLTSAIKEGITVRLSGGVVPTNATNHKITWKAISGQASIAGDNITAAAGSQGSNLYIRAVVPNGKAKGVDFESAPIKIEIEAPLVSLRVVGLYNNASIDPQKIDIVYLDNTIYTLEADKTAGACTGPTNNTQRICNYVSSSILPAGKVIKSIIPYDNATGATQDTANAFLLGRIDSDHITVRINNSNKPMLRDPDDTNKYIHIGSYAGFQLITTGDGSGTLSMQAHYLQEGDLYLMGDIADDATHLTVARDGLVVPKWRPIGNAEQRQADPCSSFCSSYAANAEGFFKGVFDGGGHKIYNLNVDVTAAPNNTKLAGLFSGLDGSVGPHNVIIRNVHIESGDVKGNECTGGVVGAVNGGSVESSSNRADIVGANNYGTGGIAGLVYSGDYEVNMSALANFGNITSTGSTAGGIVGRAKAYKAESWCANGGKGVYLSAAYNKGAIVGRLFLGGIAGDISSDDSSNIVRMRAVYNAGIVNPSAGPNNPQGIVNPNGESSGDLAGAAQGVIEGYYAYLFYNGANTGMRGGGDSSFISPFYSDWPANRDNLYWGVGADCYNGYCWKALGRYNNGTPIYPTLFWE